MRGTFPGAAAAALFSLLPAEAQCRDAGFPSASERAWSAEPIDLVVNGGFEDPAIDNYRFFDEGISGWTVSRDRIEIINQSYGQGLQARSGRQFLALNGAGGLYQEISTRPDTIYRLVFHMAREPDAKGPTTLVVNAGTTQADYTIPLAQSGYRRETLSFRGAVGTVTRIAISSTTAAEAGPLVDDVSIEVAGSEE